MKKFRLTPPSPYVPKELDDQIALWLTVSQIEFPDHQLKTAPAHRGNNCKNYRLTVGAGAWGAFHDFCLSSTLNDC